jgi:hypothetical protein
MSAQKRAKTREQRGNVLADKLDNRPASLRLSPRLFWRACYSIGLVAFLWFDSSARFLNVNALRELAFVHTKNSRGLAPKSHLGTFQEMKLPLTLQAVTNQSQLRI